MVHPPPLLLHSSLPLSLPLSENKPVNKVEEAEEKREPKFDPKELLSVSKQHITFFVLI